MACTIIRLYTSSRVKCIRTYASLSVQVLLAQVHPRFLRIYIILRVVFFTWNTSILDPHSRLFNYTYYKRPVTRSAIRINVHILETGCDKSVIEASHCHAYWTFFVYVSNCWANKPIGKRTIKSHWHTHYHVTPRRWRSQSFCHELVRTPRMNRYW